MTGLSACGETVKITGPVSRGHIVILMDLMELCFGPSLQHTNITVLVPFAPLTVTVFILVSTRRPHKEMLVTHFGHSYRIFREILI